MASSKWNQGACISFRFNPFKAVWSSFLCQSNKNCLPRISKIVTHYPKMTFKKVQNNVFHYTPKGINWNQRSSSSATNIVCNFRDERKCCSTQDRERLSRRSNALSSIRVKVILEGLPSKHRSVNAGHSTTMLQIVAKLPEHKRQSPKTKQAREKQSRAHL